MDTRREVRFAADLPAVVRLEGPDRSRRHARVTNRSRSGMLLELECPVERGARLYVECEGIVAWATVAHCHPGQDSFFAGVELDTSSEVAAGAHLSDQASSFANP